VHSFCNRELVLDDFPLGQLYSNTSKHDGKRERDKAKKETYCDRGINECDVYSRDDITGREQKRE